MITISEHAQGCILPVRAQPGARKNGIIGVHAGALRVAVSAAPERGKANEAIRTILCDALACKASQVTLIAGETSRDKRFLITGMAPDELSRRLVSALPEGTTRANSNS